MHRSLYRGKRAKLATSGELQRVSTGDLIRCSPDRSISISSRSSASSSSASSHCRVCPDRLPRSNRWTFRLGCKAHVGDGDGQIAQVVLQRARALYLQKLSEGAVEESLLLRHGRDAPRRVWPPVLHHLRGRPVVSRGAIGSRQRPQFERHREFRQRNALRQEFQQCDGFEADDRRRLCDGGDDNLLQRLLPELGGKIRHAFSRSFVQFDGEGDTANARPRAIGGHPAVLLRANVPAQRSGQRRTPTARATFRLERS